MPRIALLASLILAFVAHAQHAQQQSRDGLNALTDDALMNELAARGLDTLLNRAFEVNNVPNAERHARRSLVSLSRLADPKAKLTSSERQQLVNEIVRGIEPALASLDDPQLLMRQAFVLITAGVERDVNTLEYWGENPRTQAQLRPVVETVVKMLERSEQLARKRAEDLAAKINSPSSPLVAKYEEMDRLAATAEYTKHMAYYYVALALDQSSARRRQVADQAFEYLHQFDVDENPDRNLVRTRMAKLKMARGDYNAAREAFDLVTDSPTAETKNLAIQYEARYFAAVTELLAKNVNTAKAHLAELVKWQQRNLPQQDQAARQGAEAAAAMLEYRIKSLEADQARDPATKKAANDAAVAVLMNLIQQRPDLRGVIYEQLLPKMEEQTDLTKLDPLLLRALVARGEDQLRAPPNQLDRKTLEQALAAAREMANRAGQQGVDPQTADAASLLVGFFLDKLDQKPDAARAFLEYAEKAKSSNLKNATLALDNAQALIGQLRQQQRDDPAVVELYERFLPLAIAPPFARTQFAFEWARRLQLNGKPAEAVAFYRMVPANDKRSLDARYFELVALTQRLDDAPANERPAILADVQRLADEVSRGANEALAKAASDEQRQAQRSMLARTSLLAADLARREQKDPARALRLVENFEQQSQGLPNADALAADAMFIRVQAFMAQEKYTEATQELVRLLNKTEGGHGAQIVYNLLEKLNADFDRAQAAGDAAQMRVLAKNRAQLSGFLVGWAENNADPNIKRFTYRYKVFDADTHRRSADLDPDPASRAKGLNDALAKYQSLESPENVELYRQSIDPNLVDPAAPDPQVEFGVALIHYDLGNWKEAADRFSRLLTSRRIGNPVNAVQQEDGETRYADNDAYWEVVLKLIRCNQRLGTGVEESRSFLKQQYITWGERVGGKKWKGEYETLRNELIPGFDVEPVAATQPQS